MNSLSILLLLNMLISMIRLLKRWAKTKKDISFALVFVLAGGQ